MSQIRILTARRKKERKEDLFVITARTRVRFLGMQSGYQLVYSLQGWSCWCLVDCIFQGTLSARTEPDGDWLSLDASL